MPDLYRKKRYELLTSNEVCSLLKISLRTLYRMIKRGALPTAKVGGDYRFRVDEVITYYETMPRSYPLYFKPDVLKEYLYRQPDKYEVQPIKGGGGWIKIKELYKQTMAKDTPEGLIRYHERRWPKGEKVILLTQPQFRRLPPPEQIHWRCFEIH